MENRFGPEAPYDGFAEEEPAIAEIRQILGEAQAPLWLDNDLSEDTIAIAEMDKEFETLEQRCIRFTGAYVVAAAAHKEVYFKNNLTGRNFYPGNPDETDGLYGTKQPHPMYTLRENLYQEMMAVSAERPEAGA